MYMTCNGMELLLSCYYYSSEDYRNFTESLLVILHISPQVFISTISETKENENIAAKRKLFNIYG